MTIMSDSWIREMATKPAMIEPLLKNQRRDGVISFGLPSYGYDTRVVDAFKQGNIALPRL